MVAMKAFINLFFVPVVGLCVYYKIKSLKMVPTFDMLIRYIIIVVGVVPCSRVFTTIFRVLTDVDIIEADSSYNTIAALLAAVLLPYIFEFGRKFWNKLK